MPRIRLPPNSSAEIDAQDPQAQQRRAFGDCTAESFVNRMLAFDWKYTLADNDLVKVCGAAALAGIAVGFPFLADEVVDFSVKLEPRLKVRGLRLRYFFKQALKGFLPIEILRKKKHGFGLPFGLWVVSDPGLNALATDALRSLSARHLVRTEFVEELLNRRLPEHPGFFGEMVWILMILEHWLRAHHAGHRIV